MSPGRRGTDFVRDFVTARLLERVDYVENGIAFTRAEVKDMHAGVVHFFDRFDMSDRKVDYVDIVAYARSVGGIVVVSEYVYTRKFAVGNARDVRGKVVGDSFPDPRR